MKSLLSALALLALFCSGAFADETTYKVGPGDILSIAVTGEPDFTGTFTINSDNTIFYSYLKSIKVGDMTTREIAAYLTNVLNKDYINSPTVNVTVKEYASKTVKVLGAVNKPGSYILRGDTRILDVITLAGGLAPQAGSNVMIIRPKKTATAVTEPLVVNYSEIVNEGKLDQNILIEPEDVINVPKGNEIFVLGQVARPGPVLYKDDLTLLQAISVAGGPSPAASTKSTYIIRKDEKGGSKKLKVRLDRIMEQKEENVKLIANDVIVVPESFF